jgi:hypothetical protein
MIDSFLEDRRTDADSNRICFFLNQSSFKRATSMMIYTYHTCTSEVQ